MHHFFRMFAQINQGEMDRFVALALPGKHVFFDKGPGSDAAEMMFAAIDAVWRGARLLYAR